MAGVELSLHLGDLPGMDAFLVDLYDHAGVVNQNIWNPAIPSPVKQVPIDEVVDPNCLRRSKQDRKGICLSRERLHIPDVTRIVDIWSTTRRLDGNADFWPLKQLHLVDGRCRVRCPKVENNKAPSVGLSSCISP